MNERGIEAELARAGDAGLAWAELATVESVEQHAAFGVLLNLLERPAVGTGTPRRFQARLIQLGARDQAGLSWPVEAGDDVLAVYPGGDPNRAIAIAGLTSRKARRASSVGDHVDLVHAGGLEVRRTEAATVSRLVLESLLDALGGVLDEVIAIGSASAVPAPNSLALKAALELGAHRSAALKTE